MKSKDFVKRVSEDLNIPEQIVDKTYKAYWKFIRHSISSLPLKEQLTEEEFNKLQTNINIPSLGKLYCTYENYININKKLEYKERIKNAKDKKD